MKKEDMARILSWSLNSSEKMSGRVGERAKGRKRFCFFRPLSPSPLLPFNLLILLAILLSAPLLLLMLAWSDDTYEPTGIVTEVNYSYDFPLDLDKVKETILIKVGDEYSSYKLRKSLEAIYSLKYFSEVVVEATQSDSGVILNFLFKPKLTLKKISFSGNDIIKSSDLSADADLRSTLYAEYAPSLVESDKRKISDLYRKHGYFEVKVEAEAQIDRFSNAVSLTFQIEEGERTKVNQVEFFGNRLTASELLLREMKTKGSKTYLLQIINEDIERLKEFYRDRGYIIAQIHQPIETFLPSENKINLLIKIVEGPKVNIKGNKQIDSQLIQEILSKYLDSYSESIPKEAVEDIKDLYAKKGYYQVEVKQRTRKSSDDGIKIELQIQEGKPTTIAKIDFVGNYAVNDKDLRKQMALKQRSPLALPILNKIFSKGLYDEETLITDRRAIELFYKSKGYERAKVEEIPKSIQEHDMHITFKISEGIRTIVNKVVGFEENQEFTKEEIAEILRHLETKHDKSFDNDKILKDKAYLRTKYAEKGYIDARIETRILSTKSDSPGADSSKVDVTFVIPELKQYYVDNPFIIEVNNGTKSDVIEREILLKKGEPLNAIKLAESQQRIFGLGLFRTVSYELINEREEANRKVVDIKWIIDEKKTGIANLGLGLGYNPSEGARISFEIAQNNLSGRDWKVRFKDRLSLLEGELGNRLETMFVVPYLFETPAQLTLRASRGRSLEDRTDELRTGVSSAVTFRSRDFDKTAMVNIQYRFEDVRSANPLIAQTQTTVSGIGISFLRDTKNDPLDPTRGWYNEISVEFADGIIGKSNFIKLTGDNRRFFQLAPKLSIGFAIRGGYAAGLRGKDIIPFERFKAGGATTIRAYRERSLGPEDKLTGNNRGNVFAVFNSELRFPIYRKWRLSGAFFFDAGNVWGKLSDVDYRTIKMGVGGGVRINTLIGPIRFDYAFPLRWKPEDKIQQFSFSLGHSF